MQVNQSPSIDRRRKSRLQAALCLAMIGFFILMGFAAHGRGSQGVSKVKLSVEDPRPVAKAIEMLVGKYGWVITYEDPLYVHLDYGAERIEGDRPVDGIRFKRRLIAVKFKSEVSATNEHESSPMATKGRIANGSLRNIRVYSCSFVADPTFEAHRTAGDESPSSISSPAVWNPRLFHDDQSPV
jgi:hypothetical protein